MEGKAYVKLTQYATNLPEPLLVIGSHGASGFEEMFIGSNTMKVVGVSKIPVLIIGHNVNVKRDLTKILVPVDTSFETLQKIKPAAQFANLFSAKISLLGLCENSAAIKKTLTALTVAIKVLRSKIIGFFAALDCRSKILIKIC